MFSAVERRVVVGLDRGDVDPRAVRTAVDLARAFDSVLYIIDVQRGGESGTAGGRGTPRMQDAYFALSKSGGLPDDVDVRIVVVVGDPGEQLVRLADRSTDFLVVARGPNPRDAMSVIAGNCMDNAGCAVIVVPPEPDSGHEYSRSREDCTIAS